MSYAETIRRQPDVSAVVGQTVTIPCRTSAGKSGIWYYKNNPWASVKDLFNVRGDLMNGFKRSGRFSLARDAVGDYSLVIGNISVSDAGLYTCVNDDGYGVYFITRLNVSGSPRYHHHLHLHHLPHQNY